MKRKKSPKQKEIKIPIEELSLEQLRELIDNGSIEGEMPFDLVATHYPDLLDDWYPGYPGTPRPAKKGDPFPAQIIAKDGKMHLDIPGMEDQTFSLEGELPEGKHDVWLMQEEDKWFIYGREPISNESCCTASCCCESCCDEPAK